MSVPFEASLGEAQVWWVGVGIWVLFMFLFPNFLLEMHPSRALVSCLHYGCEHVYFLLVT